MEYHWLLPLASRSRAREKEKKSKDRKILPRMEPDNMTYLLEWPILIRVKSPRNLLSNVNPSTWQYNVEAKGYASLAARLTSDLIRSGQQTYGIRARPSAECRTPPQFLRCSYRVDRWPCIESHSIILPFCRLVVADYLPLSEPYRLLICRSFVIAIYRTGP